MQAWTCAATPVHDPETGELIGVIDVTGLKKHVHPDTLAVVTTTARAVESQLRRLRQEREGRSRPGDPLRLTSHERIPALGRRRALRDRLSQLSEEQAALRRLATAVARGVPPAEIFRAVAQEVGPLLGADDAAVVRFDPDRAATVLAGVGIWADDLERRVEQDDLEAITEVFRMGRSVRVDRRDRITASGLITPYPRRASNASVVATPIVLDGRLWGAMIVSTRDELLAADIERRMAHFTELVGVVVANAESRGELIASRARVASAGDIARCAGLARAPARVRRGHRRATAAGVGGGGLLHLRRGAHQRCQARPSR